MTRTTTRAAVAVACLLVVYATAVGGVVLLAMLSIRLVLDEGYGTATATAVAALGLGLLLAADVAHAVRRSPAHPVGLSLGEDSFPLVWAEVVDLARQVGAEPPDEIWLVVEPEVRVTEDVSRLGLVARTRRLCVGVPLLLTLERSELRALVVHELARYRGGFLGSSSIAYRGQRILGDLAVREQGTRPLGTLLGWCARSFTKVAAPVNHQQEVEADVATARIVGAGPAVAALRQLPAVQAMWDHYLDQHAFAAPGLRPLRLFEGFADLWRDDLVQRGLVGVRDEPAARPASPYDTALSTEERLELLAGTRADTQAAGRREPLVDRTPAARFVKRAGLHALELETALFRWSDLRPAPWGEIAATAARLQLGATAARVPQPLEACVRDLCSGRARSLTRDVLDPGASAAVARRTAVELVTARVAAALLERGAVRAVPSWATTWRLVDAAGHSVDVELLVESAYDDPAGTEVLLGLLRREGLVLHRPGQPAAALGEPHLLVHRPA